MKDKFIPITKKQIIKDHVIDLCTYTEIDYDNLFNELNTRYMAKGGCSVAYKAITKNGKKEFIVGRNLDLSISNNPAYIVRTAVKNEYKTIGLTYTSFPSQTYEDILKRGMSEDLYNKMPFMCTDIMNEKGLYIEINMRNYEAYPNGEDKYICTHSRTLEIKKYNNTLHNFELLQKVDIAEPKRQICITLLSRYLARHCDSVGDVIEELKSLDVFSPNSFINWNFCLYIADKNGNHGVLELARSIIGPDNSFGKLVFIQDAPGQTNFYLNPEFAYLEEYKSGVGRFNTIIKTLPKIKNEKDMFNLMNTISYNQIYTKDEWVDDILRNKVKNFNSHCKFDKSTEFVELCWWITNKLLESGDFKDDVQSSINKICETYESLSEEEIRKEAKYWQSSFTIVANCSKCQMHIRFFENPKYIFNGKEDFIIHF